MKSWEFGKFKKEGKPILFPNNEFEFACPIQNKKVEFSKTNVYNPAAIIKDGVMHLIYRADGEELGGIDHFGNKKVVCRLAHATSEDGINFIQDSTPVIYPDKDECEEFEWWGGCSDLHIVEDRNGRYYMNYDAWTGFFDVEAGYDLGVEKKDGDQWQDVLMSAWSDDLVHWHKCGPALKEKWKKYYNHSRSGTVICKAVGDKLIAERINGKYYMYMSHKGTLLSSEDLIKWDVVLDADGNLVQIFPGYEEKGFDGMSHEAGAAAILCDEGIVYFYNAYGFVEEAKDIDCACWSLGQALISKDDLVTVIDKQENPFLYPEYEWEKVGHTTCACVVCNTLVKWDNKWMLYYGAGDHVISRAVEEKD